MKDLKELFYEAGLVPVIKIESVKMADGLANALCAGGLSVAEITFRTKAAPQVIEKIASFRKDITVGAGTVTTKEEVNAALSAGAQFIVSPGFNPSICEYCLERGVPVFPGVNNPSLIEQAMSMGLTTLKFFPAEVSGGVKALNALKSVYQQVSFIPTGGIQEDNIQEYLTLKNVLACGGSWIVSTELIEAGKFDEIERLIKSARRTMMGFLPIARGDEGSRASSGSSGEVKRDRGFIEVRTPSLKRTLAMLSPLGASVIPGSEIMKGQSLIGASIDIPGIETHIRLIE
ncbi:MAG: bifunctional 4-hydroxy-2-oxoglutarate aldolase/2-dehydro-3-deoxy-phosphogluconate aldolase [Rectinema sp.]|jgi:2-dehydro-3-deoxyphosphogluconate aldolase/(4S)-4-hydroxy-2-oxoglutarate aldolase|uniref:2-dehydro-3-deoxy-phosphogluconate aldolase n=1 Tax=uncultured spirochete TaxID=156406 RepID=A0A3P3XQW2_9SPIR|nr:Putative KHG/KDPG aldolase (Includes: 4-hydroxy-2-oxoglutarate aldolase; 2-dehydro-3-deoxy-phosphogluconate aldolase) (modular protein) [uncultured spirochete]